jgi:hypothetical protein
VLCDLARTKEKAEVQDLLHANRLLLVAGVVADLQLALGQRAQADVKNEERDFFL